MIVTATTEDATVEIYKQNIEKVDEFLSLGHTQRIDRNNQTAELSRRIWMTCAAANKLGSML